MKHKGTIVLALISVAVLMLCMTGCGNNSDEDAADKVIIGDIYTGDEDNPSATAMAEKDGEIIFVGDKKDVEKYVGDSTEVTEYKDGELITAGLADGHTHVSQLLISKADKLCSIENGASEEECIATIEKFIKENPDLDFINASGWIDSSFDELGPTAKMLDQIDTDKPIAALSADGHSYWVNSILLKKTGVTAKTEDPMGGKIVKYEDGTPTGCFKDTAKNYIDCEKPPKTKKATVEGLKGAEAINVEQGYVMRFQAGDNESFDATKAPLIKRSEEQDQAGEMNTYIQASFQINNTDDAVDMVDKAVEYRDKTEGGNYEVTTVKVFMDGIIENQGAYLSSPYTNNPENSGKPIWENDESIEKLGHVIAKANKNGMNVHFHVMGDQAVSDALTAIELAADEVGIDTVKEARNALVHLALVQNEDFERFAKYNVVAVLNPWCFKDPSYFDQQVEYLGEERANNQYPMKSFLDNGVHIAFGTDLGASFTYESIECFHALATRTYNDDSEDSLLGEAEILSREETLDAMTKGVAYQLRKEDVFGTITVGKMANITVFDQNLLTVDEDEIMNTKVLNCMYDGNWLGETGDNN